MEAWEEAGAEDFLSNNSKQGPDSADNSNSESLRGKRPNENMIKMSHKGAKMTFQTYS